MKPTPQNDNASIEALLAQNPNVTPTGALANAIATFQKEQAAQESELALARLREIASVSTQIVNELRTVRQMERRITTQLKAVSAAQTAFLKTGDWDAFRKAFGAASAARYGNPA